MARIGVAAFQQGLAERRVHNPAQTSQTELMSKPSSFPGRVAEVLRRSTVQVKSDFAAVGGVGSGIILPGNAVLTNAHVGRGNNISIECWDGAAMRAAAVRSDSQRDLCLLECAGNLTGPPVTLGDSERLQPGTPVFAVGNPLGFIGAVSTGTVHSIGSFGLRSPLLRQSWIRARLVLAPGNSGGPLADFTGAVVGLNTMVVSGGIALAVPSRGIQSFLKNSGVTLGVTIRPVRLPDGATALMILELSPGGPADVASLLPGDILLSANDRPLVSPDALEQSMTDAKDGQLHLVFRRGGQSNARQVTVQLQPVRLGKAA
ncbi:MAG: trypsin-like peptidase domain-containing protein [Acidobacteriaceae bacterium]|nr:trypsin-like peptidase domain-containing protein [Acidobacteriaceae bacterium]